MPEDDKKDDGKHQGPRAPLAPFPAPPPPHPDGSTPPGDGGHRKPGS
ncbi:hypothetical protein STBA_43250 [Streptomyces sp. MP131-18]|nr:hypothetical protein STBA_43250 [Streptomyces sp. MP131-18]